MADCDALFPPNLGAGVAAGNAQAADDVLHAGQDDAGHGGNANHVADDGDDEDSSDGDMHSDDEYDFDMDADSGDDDEDDDDDLEAEAMPGAVHSSCHRQIKYLSRELQRYRELYEATLTQKEKLQQEANTLAARLATRARGGHKQRTWQDKLHAALADPRPLNPEGPLYLEIYKLSCAEENMSVKVANVHPGIKLVKPDIFNRPCAYPYSIDAPSVVYNQAFRFENLPLNIQGRIFQKWLYIPGQLVHCFSRLDPFVAPDRFPAVDHQRISGLPNVFYWGPREVSLTNNCRPPGDVLRVLLVNKHFHFIGTHCFYSMNTFAFSSLGEFFRFCSGIGPARVDRLQHVEITYMGNQYLTMLPDANKKQFSVRTHALYFLQDCHRLRTLVVHINETGKTYMRRRYETAPAVDFMAKKTAGQPSYRKTRALRTVQGMDCIYQLRGMNWIRFYDLQVAKQNRGARVEVRDWSFIEDVTNTSCMGKVPARKERSELEELQPLLPTVNGSGGWQPTEGHFQLVGTFYLDFAGEYAFDNLRQSIYHADINIPSHAGDTLAYSISGFSSDSDSCSSADPRNSHSPPPSSSPSSSSSDSSFPSGSIGDPIVLLSDSEAESSDSVASSDGSKPSIKIEDAKSEAGNFLDFLRNQSPIWLNTSTKRPRASGAEGEAPGIKRPRV